MYWGVFTWERLSPEKVSWLRLFANHAAVAIANARAFEQIEQLRRRLESENEYLREEFQVAQGFGDMVGQSSALRNVLAQVGLVGASNAARPAGGSFVQVVSENVVSSTLASVLARARNTARWIATTVLPVPGMGTTTSC